MPVLRFKPGRVEEALRLPLTEALKAVERLKIEAELTEEGYVEFEIEVDRPDMYTLEGVARQLDGLLGRARGLPSYEVVDSGFTIHVSDVPTRPYIAGAVVWDVNVDEDFLEELIQFQEKLHISLGGNRERVAIGLHDLSKLPSKRLLYRFERIDNVVFQPLGYSEEMSLRRVLEETKQGREYGSLSLRDGMHPVLYSGSDVISVPPVINAELTRIEPGTRHVFIDVTGTSLDTVLKTLTIIAANLAERSPSRRIGRVRVVAGWGELNEPSMAPEKMSLNPGYVSSTIGVEMDAGEVAEKLEAMRFGASVEGGIVEVLVPAYRVDILHPVDLVEEVVLALGIEALPPKPLERMMRGRLLPSRYWEREARKLLVGLGFVEVMGYSLTSCRERILFPAEAGLLKLSNPVGEESACLRGSLAGQLLSIASRNQHLIPVRLFELGEVYYESRGRIEARKRLGILVMDNKAGYEDIQAVVYTLIRLLGDEILRVERWETPLTIPGRTAWVETRSGLVAVLGEVHPSVLEEMGIEYPVALAEIDYGSVSRGVPRP